MILAKKKAGEVFMLLSLYFLKYDLLSIMTSETI